MSKKIEREPTFNNPLFLFEPVMGKLSPVKKVQLTKLQKELIIKHGFISMRVEQKIIMLNAHKDGLLKNENKFDQYKTVVDVVNGQILILGIYKVEEETNGSN